MGIVILAISLILNFSIPNWIAILGVTLGGTYFLGGMFFLGGFIRLIFLGFNLMKKR